ncbi:hypothetical protein [Rubrivirga marina]|uniref:DUF5666 domain-containing protein n=1 Tax=Rubrivirga marina TaxID=1196024 RepID=A0A271IWK4_9BACT|nr:hypothetical protein [Rubrivirga marina]PAP75318.1 hypothetical protein BSZ37_02095 [Rubrivirga marina]
MTRLLALMLLVGCASRTPPPDPPVDESAPPAEADEAPPSDATRLAGTVLSVDLSPMAADGDARIEVETDRGPRQTIFVAARMNLCEAAGLSLVSDLAPGDRVRVVGDAVEGGIRPCAGADHLLARAEVETGTVRGIVETGFETSAFRPCDGSDERWWLTPSEAVADRMFALQEAHTTGDEGRGLRVVYAATLTGDVRPGEVYGHLGQYVAEFEAREAVALEVLAVNPETPIACPAP